MQSTNQNYIWFLDTLVNIRVSEKEGFDGISVLEHKAYKDDSPPMHIHKNEDEIFYVLEGEFHFVVADKEHYLKKGDVLLMPKGIPHTYLITSSTGGRWLTITNGKDFERFVQKIGRPAKRIELPPKSVPSKDDIDKLTKAAKDYNIYIVGTPLH